MLRPEVDINARREAVGINIDRRPSQTLTTENPLVECYYYTLLLYEGLDGIYWLEINGHFQYWLENNKQKNYWLENNEGLKYKE